MLRDPKRQRVISDFIFVIIGTFGIAVAFGRLGNNIPYPPTDLRSQPWFDPLVFWIQITISLVMLTAGAVRLLQDYRGRTK